jgi:hypothetical protein
MKFCWKCETVHLLACFATDRHQRDDHRPYCRTCEATRKRAYRRTPAGIATYQARRERLGARSQAA